MLIAVHERFIQENHSGNDITKTFVDDSFSRVTNGVKSALHMLGAVGPRLTGVIVVSFLNPRVVKSILRARLKYL